MFSILFQLFNENHCSGKCYMLFSIQFKLDSSVIIFFKFTFCNFISSYDHHFSDNILQAHLITCEMDIVFRNFAEFVNSFTSLWEELKARADTPNRIRRSVSRSPIADACRQAVIPSAAGQHDARVCSRFVEMIT